MFASRGDYVCKLLQLLVGLDAARRNRDESVSAQDQLTALSLLWTITLNARMMTRLVKQQ